MLREPPSHQCESPLEQAHKGVSLRSHNAGGIRKKPRSEISPNDQTVSESIRNRLPFIVRRRQVSAVGARRGAD